MFIMGPQLDGEMPPQMCSFRLMESVTYSLPACVLFFTDVLCYFFSEDNVRCFIDNCSKIVNYANDMVLYPNS